MKLLSTIYKGLLTRKAFLLIFIIVFFSCEKEDYIVLEKESSQGIDKMNANLDSQLLSALGNASGGVGVSFFILPESNDYANIPQDPLNPITAEKVKLGKLLFHDTATGGNPKSAANLHTYSCASCHHAAAGFSAGVRQGIGEGGIGFGVNGEGRIIDPNISVDLVDIQPIRSPTILNAAFQRIMLWNGQFGAMGPNIGTEANWANIPENFLGFEGVEVQALKGQDVHGLLINEDFATNFNYKGLFNKAFPDIPKAERYTRETGGLAIAAYERTVLANESPWQQWLKGDSNALSNKEKRGAKLFFGKAKCYECHTGPALNDENFYALGMFDFSNSPGNPVVVKDTLSFKRNVRLGRKGFSNLGRDRFKFKTPTLYNLTDNGFYGHGGSFTSIRDIVVYKLNGIPQKDGTNGQAPVPTHLLDPIFKEQQNLTQNQINNLVLFIENGLRDPNLDRYVPNKVRSGNCIPNSDDASKIDLGCN
ncbi:cytochrome-c peroxidase [Aquimarina sp. D1M17]|uniref:cytochrome-c peroxidase n=1 Tax=Aquimarina acroporae TaxID=2937283 RepID=UPI0020C13A09|nr:cytochrome c peroxidase [Aquimarina acroporae]MCK8522627.1 cytochrome-c peroxidase [Aquimarina acroporae]